ncbi:hypothetical protein SS05631_c28450 [Sinorhizobium sp. CCBAU 05631]|nr:hypothetical protein SS05631_c28450 [Sinorhizobium sp. CCBAU 05631]
MIVLYAFDNWRHGADLNFGGRFIRPCFLPLRQEHLRQ